MNQSGTHMCSPSRTPLPPPSPSHPPGTSHPPGHPPGAPALGTLSHASNLDWQSTSHMKIYMFQCYPLKSSHPCLLPQSPKDCPFHLCLFWCLTCGVIITIFLFFSFIFIIHTYALVYCIGDFLSALLHSV